ncbi:hypothetical protein [Hungatella hathewayi]|uniref:Uncharacterized protein n=1 Tax=Hungatella hathewayi TaxID=154046 RepID=A0A174MUC6_9FIRM|nr:hypothetical protein [Hungatella hathewayi]CUP39873.1 Uncharacterised protein [Hungatella hathewayi]
MKMTKQRLMGFALVAVSVLLLLLASTGETLEERDATAVLIMILPLGLYMTATKNYMLYDGEEPVIEEEDE